jgi:hypothetical protein
MEKRLTMILACLFLSIGMALAQTQVTGTVAAQLQISVMPFKDKSLVFRCSLLLVSLRRVFLFVCVV